MKTKRVQFALGAVLVVAVAAGARASDKADSFTVDGEQFTVRQITDENFNGLVAYRFSAPKDWRDSGHTLSLIHIFSPPIVAHAPFTPCVGADAIARRRTGQRDPGGVATVCGQPLAGRRSHSGRLIGQDSRSELRRLFRRGPEEAHAARFHVLDRFAIEVHDSRGIHDACR